MVTATFAKDDGIRKVSFKAKGHANYAENGKDIVCASCSILAYTLAQEVNMIEKAENILLSKECAIGDDGAEIECRANDNEGYFELLTVFRTIYSGYKLLCDKYPEYVALKLVDKTV